MEKQLSTLSQARSESLAELNTVCSENENLRSINAKLDTSNVNLQASLEQKDAIITTQQSSLNYYRKLGMKKKLQRREAKISSLEADLKKNLEQHGYKMKILQCKLRNIQLKFVDLKQKMKHLKRKNLKIQMDLKEKLHDVPDTEQEQHDVIHLKDESGHFKRETVVCVIALIGELEVPAHKCGQVIQTVFHHLLGAQIPKDELPSQRSALRFVDQGHVIGKAHITETLLENEQWDLHTDGTTKHGKKYIGQQITVHGQSLSTGFTAVTTENTATLVAATISLVEELADVFPDGNNHEHLVTMLQKLSGSMTDRASVMKSFDKALQKERQNLLQTEEGIEFLHCNAHYLLGLSAASEKVLAKDEADMGVKLGRDQLPQFHHFKSNETSALRYLRLASDCLGPCGDEKNGCRESWEAYCMMMGKTSKVPSFRRNRFNCLFQTAAGLHYHRTDINDFLGNCLPSLNGKLSNSPYWQLLGSGVPYLQFFTFVSKLHHLLQTWSQNASSAFDEHFEPLFGLQFMPDNLVYLSLINVSEEYKHDIQQILQKICLEMVETTKRQLEDFLPGGRYHAIESPELIEKMGHSAITNLFGEQCFGDLDFSIFKRRNSTLHHHSTINILKRNKSITWFSCQPHEKQSELLRLSATKAKSLRKKHVAAERDAVARRKVILEESRQQKQKTAAKKQLRIEDIMDSLHQHHGPCKTSADVDTVLASYSSRTSQKAAIQAELRYQSVVLGQKSPLLRLTGTLLSLAKNLKHFLGLENEESLSTWQLPSLQLPTTRNKQMLRDTNDSCSSNDSLFAASDVINDQEQDFSFQKFSFTRAGQMIAVYFDEDFYIGEVTDVNSSDKGVVNFMEKAEVGELTVFRWPTRPDKCTVSSECVFEKDFDLHPSSSSGRTFFVSLEVMLSSKYIAFKGHLYS